MDAHELLYVWSSHGWPVMVNHLWQATLFFFIARIAVACIKTGSANTRYGIWLMVSAKFVIPSALLVSLAGLAGWDIPAAFTLSSSPPLSTPAFSQLAEPVLQPLPMPPPAPPASEFATARGHSEWSCALTILWLTGCAFWLVRWQVRRRRFARIIQSATCITAGKEFDLLRQLQSQVGLRRAVGLVISSVIIEPVVWRTCKPVIVLPERMAEQLNEAELAAVLLHELIHIARQDNLAANLQMLLCCLFWFHPLIWVLDRKLLTERECVCDERVLAFGTEAKTYATSLLKVMRFCLGWKVAGVSSATGSNLQKRIELILSAGGLPSHTRVHRAVMAFIALIALTLTLAATFFHSDAAFAQPPRSAVTASVVQPTEQTAPVLAGASTPQAQGQPVLSQEERDDLWRQVSAAEFVPTKFKNADDAPLIIMDSKIKVVPIGDNLELVTAPVVALQNTSGRPINFLRLQLTISSEARDIVGFPVRILPNASFVLRPNERQWWNTVKRAPKAIHTQIVGVRFDDGSTWGNVPYNENTPAIASAAPDAPPGSTEVTATPSANEAPPTEPPSSLPIGLLAHDRVEYAPAYYLNSTGAPLVIREAITPIILRAANNFLPDSNTAYLPTVTLINTTAQRIVALKIRFKTKTDEHAVNAFRATIEPHSPFVYRPKPSLYLSGKATDMRVQIIGVEFEDGSVWGSMNSRINTREEWIEVPQTIRRPE